MKRQTGRVGLAAVATAALAAGLLLFVALRPAEPSTVRPIDIPAEGGEQGNRVEPRFPSGGAAPVSPLPPPPAGDRPEDDGGSGDDGRGSDDGGGGLDETDPGDDVPEDDIPEEDDDGGGGDD